MMALPTPLTATVPLVAPTTATFEAEEIQVTGKPALWVAVNWNKEDVMVLFGMTSGLIEIVGLALPIVKVPLIRLLV
jgi:hypothetical protein